MVVQALRPVRRAVLLLIAPVLALAPAGCGPLIDLGGSEGPVAHYALTPLDELPRDFDQRGVVLFVEEPTLPGGLRSSAIAVRSSETRIEYLSGAQWAERPSEMIRRQLIETLEKAGLAQIVGQGSLEIASDYRLKSDIRAFQADAAEGPARAQARIAVVVKLVRTAPTEIIATRRFEASAQADSRDLDRTIAALDAALHVILTDVVMWLDDTALPAAEPDAPPSVVSTPDPHIPGSS